MADQKVSNLPALNGADVDSADLLYIVDSSAGTAGSKKITIGQYQLAPVSGGTANGVTYLNGSKVLTSGSALTFDGTNLGIGTSSPGAKLDVNGNARLSNGTGFTTANSLVRQLESVAGAANQFTIGSIGFFTGGFSDQGQIVFSTNNSGGNTERMRLDASGNLGLGVTPSAWGSNYKAFESSAAAAVAIAGANVNGVSIISNAYSNNTNWIYKTTGTAALYSVNASQHQWFTAPSGTAGNAITFTQAMTLDSSGNLGLGVTPSAWSGGPAIQVGGSSSAALFSDTNNTNLTTNAYYNGSWRYQTSSVAASSFQSSSGAFRWFTAPSGTAGNAITFTQAMTLDASGNLIVGGTSAVYGSAGRGLITINGSSQALLGFTVGGLDKGFLYHAGTDMTLSNTVAGAVIFQTNNTERARITSGGDLLVGTTTAPTSSNAGFVLAKDADGTYLRNACIITTTRTHFEFVNGNGTVGSISTNGSATAFNTSSDRRLKENIQPADDAASVIDAIEVVQHDWKIGGHTRFGVIAQDLHAIAPEAVTPGDDSDEIEKTWGVDYSKLVPMLIKEIQTLRARVAALEAK